MLKLINGRGQIGEALNKIASKIVIDEDIYVYHTWNFLDKTEKVQKKCYNNFVKFVNKHKNEFIVYIGTSIKGNNFYFDYKTKAENYLQKNSIRYKIIKIPNLIGKGICTKFKNNEVEAYGNIELLTIDLVAKLVWNNIMLNDNNYIYIKGREIPAFLVKELILFGAKK